MSPPGIGRMPQGQATVQYREHPSRDRSGPHLILGWVRCAPLLPVRVSTQKIHELSKTRAVPIEPKGSETKMNIHKGVPGQMVNIKKRFRTYCTAKAEQAALGKTPKAVSFGHRKNLAEMINSDAPDEVVHVLTDYRAANKVVARTTMDRKTAFELNKRLKGTGMAFAVKTGY